MTLILNFIQIVLNVEETTMLQQIVRQLKDGLPNAQMIVRQLTTFQPTQKT